MTLQRQPGREHLVGEFLGSCGVEFAAQEALNLHRLGVELIRQGPDIVAMPGEARFEIVDLLRQDRLDDFQRDRLLTDPVAFLICVHSQRVGAERVTKPAVDAYNLLIGSFIGRGLG